MFREMAQTGYQEFEKQRQRDLEIILSITNYAQILPYLYEDLVKYNT